MCWVFRPILFTSHRDGMVIQSKGLLVLIAKQSLQTDWWLTAGHLHILIPRNCSKLLLVYNQLIISNQKHRQPLSTINYHQSNHHKTHHWSVIPRFNKAWPRELTCQLNHFSATRQESTIRPSIKPSIKQPSALTCPHHKSARAPQKPVPGRASFRQRAMDQLQCTVDGHRASQLNHWAWQNRWWSNDSYGD